jgi:hypothetical protein
MSWPWKCNQFMRVATVVTVSQRLCLYQGCKRLFHVFVAWMSERAWLLWCELSYDSLFLSVLDATVWTSPHPRATAEFPSGCLCAVL